MIDASAVNFEDAFDEYFVLLGELTNYSKILLKKPRILCFTKADTLTEDALKQLKKIIAAKKTGKYKVDKIIISSVSGMNLPELKDLIFKKLSDEEN